MIPVAAIVILLSGTPADAFKKADAFTTEGKYSEAEAVLREGMRQNASSHGFHLALGNVLLAKGKPADAYLEYFYEGLRAGADPAGAAAIKAAKDLLASNRGLDVDEARRFLQGVDSVSTNPPEARRALKTLSKERAGHFVVRFFLAETRMRSGEEEGALQELRTLTKEDPGFVPAMVLEAMSLRSLGRQKEAEAVAAKARKVSPKHWALKPLELLGQATPTPLPPTPAPTRTPPPKQ